MTDELKQEVIDLLEQIEHDAQDVGYKAAKQVFDAKVSAMQADFEEQIIKIREEYESEVAVLQENIVFVDGVEYKNDKGREFASFSYSRKFKTTKWGTIILPVVMNYSDWSDNFEIAIITGVNVGESITPTRTVLGWGTQTIPNHPYLIRAKKADANKAQSITVKNCYLFPSEAGSVEFDKDEKKYTFKGTYAKMSADNLKGKYYSSGGSFIAAKSNLNPMRVYLEITE